MPTNDEIQESIRAFFNRWSVSNEELRASHFDFFTEDCVWENAGFPTTHGPQEAVDVMVAPARDAFGLDTIRVKVLKIAVADDVVWTERVDDLLRSDGSVIVSVPIAGVMQLADDGRIQAWREYFDSKPVFDAVAAGS